MAKRIASFFTFSHNVDGANGERLLSHLGASAADYVPYRPIMLRNRGDNSNCHYSPSSATSSNQHHHPVLPVPVPAPLSRNQRRRRNRRNPPTPPSLPSTVADLTTPALPQSAIFPDDLGKSEYLTLWMHSYKPYINRRIDFNS